ncbi:SGNH/GDSL hydrolase family protein [Haloferula sp. A504]|uniref:SGNH/GDSL hydrolase family protein n=1 Tax=Haloferula sp. A504 TaxID=3373601 RepID=UPI0031BF1E27|nr:SGNH/GDSL hydrolase family protein [Verrucomicrobiaceae bacterium E54]
MNSSRRQFLTTSALASAAAVSTTPARSEETAKAGTLELKQGATILLQGDSITDAGRDKTIAEPNHTKALGNGYARMIAYHLLSKYPEKELKLYNRGISGNKVPDLDGRWEKDCLELKPDILSIMIGVNDYWHTVAFGSKYEGTVESYGTGFKALLDRTREALPDTRIVICEPFVVRAADGSTRPDWFPEFDQRREKAREAAQASGALYVEFQQMFDAAVAAGYPHKELAGDDIHPSPHGHALMASRWLGDTGLA